MFKRLFENFARPAGNFVQETCEFKFALTDSNPDEGTFTGVASVFGSIVNTWCPTVLVAGCFTKTIKESGAKVKLLHQHDTSEPIGRPTRLQETPVGLELDGKISQTSRGKDDLILMRDGVIEEMSIGFDPIDGKFEYLPLAKCIEQQLVSNPTQWADRDEKEMIRVIREVRLWEVSLVTWGADPMTGITSVHSLQHALPIADIALESFAAFTIQTLIFPKKHWSSVDDCKKWLKDHDYKTPAVDETGESYRFRQRDPGDFERLRTICINPSREADLEEDCKVKAVGGPLKEEEQMFQGPTLTDVSTVLLEVHAGKVLSAKNKKLLSDAIAALQALIDAAEPPKSNDDEQALTVNVEQLNKLANVKLWLSQTHQLTQ